MKGKAFRQFTEKLLLYHLKWGGGLLASMLLPNGDTLRTDKTWKVTYRRQPFSWYATDYDDSEWGYAEDIGNAESWPGFTNSGTKLSNLYFHQARLIYGASRNYIRKEFSASRGTGAIHIRGNNFVHQIFLNGQKVGEGTQFSQCHPENCLTTPYASYSVSFQDGMNCVGIIAEDYKKDGNGALLKAGVFGTSAPIRTDATWTINSAAGEGWSQAGHDDSEWGAAGQIGAYDPLATESSGGALEDASWIWPQTFYFRKTFQISESGTSAITSRLNQMKLSTSVHHYYDLQGRRIGAKMLTMQNKSIVIHKSTRSGTGDNVHILSTVR